jgi:hypothetical protein
MLAAVWAMEKCKIFLLGMKTFTLLALDHKPLISMLGPQPIMTIPNPRLVSCKIKSLMYSFAPTHIPGKLHVVPDSLSRRNDSPINMTDTPDTVVLDTTNVHPEYQNSCAPPSWVSFPYSTPAGVMAAFCIQPARKEKTMSEETEQYLLGHHHVRTCCCGRGPLPRPVHCPRWHLSGSSPQFSPCPGWRPQLLRVQHTANSAPSSSLVHLKTSSCGLLFSTLSTNIDIDSSQWATQCC